MRCEEMHDRVVCSFGERSDGVETVGRTGEGCRRGVDFFPSDFFLCGRGRTTEHGHHRLRFNIVEIEYSLRSILVGIALSKFICI